MFDKHRSRIYTYGIRNTHNKCVPGGDFEIESIKMYIEWRWCKWNNPLLNRTTVPKQERMFSNQHLIQLFIVMAQYQQQQKNNTTNKSIESQWRISLYAKQKKTHRSSQSPYQYIIFIQFILAGLRQSPVHDGKMEGGGEAGGRSAQVLRYNTHTHTQAHKTGNCAHTHSASSHTTTATDDESIKMFMPRALKVVKIDFPVSP